MAHKDGTPTPYGFDLDEGEEITRIIKRHPMTLLPSWLTAATLTSAAALLTYVSGRYPDVFPIPGTMVLALAFLMVMLAVIFIWVGLVNYRGNVLIFTNIHLVMAEQHGLFSHRVSQVHFTRIQDVTGHKHGIVQALFGYGVVEIQSAGEKTRFIFTGAPHPQQIADDALEIHERRLKELGMNETG
ncbi:MAG: hypothetical protein K0S68_496 [Candidatus Saccharibacteria bacterium]|jgi:uncharacterized membrane protein YdbT with pleckstrin-like domain|nr:hypothetical protein [Candidatus Saccharibacteria bacterium]